MAERMPTTNEIRATFLDYFRAHGHEVVASSPLVPHNDPTLLFTNAGMVPVQERLHRRRARGPTSAPPPRRSACAPAASTTTSTTSATPPGTTPSSRCWATSPSATTSRTLAISWPGSWSPRSSGCRPSGSSPPSTPRTTRPTTSGRRSPGLPEGRIIRIATSDNFWAMGDTGPCGPCSEIFFDHGPDITGGPPGSPDEDGDRFIEIWNLVFMQYEQVDKATAPAAAAPLDRHRHGPRAHRGRAAGRPRQLRHRPLQGADRRLGGADRRARPRARGAPRTRSSPTTCAPRPS